MRILRRGGVPSDTAIAVGSFDGVHRGHTAMFERLLESARGRALAAAVLTFEPLPPEFFAPAEAPARLTSLPEKLVLIAERGIDCAIVERFDRSFASLRGRGIGFPTANVRLGRRKPALPGIFAVKCYGAATRGLEGVASLGTNPAVRASGPATLEAFLFDFSGDLYGRRLTVEFVKKLRDEAHFASMEALAAQIRRDCDAARECFRTAE